MPITSLHEIVRVPEITARPCADVEGVINLRGKIRTLRGELRKRFGEKQITLRRQNRILVVEHAGRSVGFIVTSLRGSKDSRGCRGVRPAPVLQDGGLNCVTGLGKVAGRLVVLLDMSKLLAPAASRSKTRASRSGLQVRAVPRHDSRMGKTSCKFP